MQHRSSFHSILLALASLLLASACSTGSSTSSDQVKPGESVQESPGEATPTESASGGDADTQMVHPKGAYCTDNGGKLELYVSESGGQSQLCLFDDGSRCTAMAFWRKECAKGSCMAENGKCDPANP